MFTGNVLGTLQERYQGTFPGEPLGNGYRNVPCLLGSAMKIVPLSTLDLLYINWCSVFLIPHVPYHLHGILTQDFVGYEIVQGS